MPTRRSAPILSVLQRTLGLTLLGMWNVAPAHALEGMARLGVGAGWWAGQVSSDSARGNVGLHGLSTTAELSGGMGSAVAFFGLSVGLAVAPRLVVASDENYALRPSVQPALGLRSEFHSDEGPWHLVLAGRALPYARLEGITHRSPFENYGGLSWGVGVGVDLPWKHEGWAWGLTARFDALQMRGRGDQGVEHRQRATAWVPGIEWTVGAQGDM